MNIQYFYYPGREGYHILCDRSDCFDRYKKKLLGSKCDGADIALNKLIYIPLES